MNKLNFTFLYLIDHKNYISSFVCVFIRIGNNETIVLVRKKKETIFLILEKKCERFAAEGAHLVVRIAHPARRGDVGHPCSLLYLNHGPVDQLEFMTS